MEKLVVENATFKFYINDMTKSLDEYCTNERVNNLLPLKNHKVFLAENKKNGLKCFLLCDNDTPIKSGYTIDEIASYINVLRFRKTGELQNGQAD